jgi:hypothetical protein
MNAMHASRDSRANVGQAGLIEVDLTGGRQLCRENPLLDRRGADFGPRSRLRCQLDDALFVIIVLIGIRVLFVVVLAVLSILL